MTTHVILVYLASLPDQMENVSVPEENMLTATFNVFHVSTTVLSAQVKSTVPCVTVDTSCKIKNVSPDAISDTTFQV